MGYLASESASEIVIRDVTGKEVSIPKSQVKLMEKVPGSLMLPGLTAGLGKQEFIDLIGFLSKIGESGKFRVANTRFVRRWESLTGDNQTTAKMLANRSFPAKGKGITTRPVYSKVSGALPLDELPEPENGSKRVSIVRFEIDVMTQGMVSLAFNATAAITAWTAGKPVKLTDSGMVVDVPQGV